MLGLRISRNAICKKPSCLLKPNHLILTGFAACMFKWICGNYAKFSFKVNRDYFNRYWI